MKKAVKTNPGGRTLQLVVETPPHAGSGFDLTAFDSSLHAQLDESYPTFSGRVNWCRWFGVDTSGHYPLPPLRLRSKLLRGRLVAIRAFSQSPYPLHTGACSFPPTRLETVSMRFGLEVRCNEPAQSCLFRRGRRPISARVGTDVLHPPARCFIL